MDPQSDIPALTRIMDAGLTAIKEQLSKIENSLGDLLGLARASDEREEEQTLNGNRVKAEIQFPNVVEQQRSREQKRQLSVQAVTAIRTLLAFIAAAIYAGIAAKQLREMRLATKAAVNAANQAEQSNIDSRTRFQQDERPYVWIASNRMGAPEFYVNPTNPTQTGQVIWTWHYTNFGRSPAYEVHYRHYVSIDGGPFVESYGSKKGKPNVHLPPSQELMSTVVSEPGFRNEQITKAEGIQGKGISIKVIIEYADALGGEYESDICIRRLNTGDVSYCEDGNNIK